MNLKEKAYEIARNQSLHEGAVKTLEAWILEALEAAFAAGLEEGIRRYAWWKDGTQYVGSCGTTLKKALERAASPAGEEG